MSQKPLPGQSLNPQLFRSDLHGSAHWMTDGEAEKMGLKSAGGVLLGQTQKGELLWFSGEGHIMVFAPTGAGKGIGFVQPNLHEVTSSMVILDPKGENTIVGAKRRRALGQKVIVLDPFGVTDEPTDTYNPLGALTYADGASVGPMIEALADALIVSKSEKDKHWTDGGRKFVAMLMWWMLAHEPPTNRNLVRLFDLAHGGYELLSKIATVMSEGRSPDADVARMCRALGNWFLGRQRREFSYFESVTTNHLGWIGDFVWKGVLGGPPSPPLPLKTSKEGMTVFLALPFQRIERYQAWLRLMVADLLASLYEVQGTPAHGPVLFLLDEAYAGLGRMESLFTAAAAVRSAGARLAFIYQDVEQVEKLYGKAWQSLVANSGVTLFWSVNDLSAAQFISARCGQRTAHVPGNPVGMAEPLQRIEDIFTLPGDEIIALFRNAPPAKFSRLDVRGDARFLGLAPNKTYGVASEKIYTARTDFVPVDLGEVKPVRPLADEDDEVDDAPAPMPVPSRLELIANYTGLEFKFLKELEALYGAELILRGDELGYVNEAGEFESVVGRDA